MIWLSAHYSCTCFFLFDYFSLPFLFVFSKENHSSWDEQNDNLTANASQPIEDEDYGYFGGTSEKEVKELEYQIQEAILAKVALENDSTLFEMGHQFEDFVFECSFKGYDCRYFC